MRSIILLGLVLFGLVLFAAPVRAGDPPRGLEGFTAHRDLATGGLLFYRKAGGYEFFARPVAPDADPAVSPLQVSEPGQAATIGQLPAYAYEGVEHDPKGAKVEGWSGTSETLKAIQEADAEQCPDDSWNPFRPRVTVSTGLEAVAPYALGVLVFVALVVLLKRK